MFGLERPTIALIEPSARMISGGPMTMPVRAPGRPIFERLYVCTQCGRQHGVASSKIMPGKGAPYALSMINGMPWRSARSDKRAISSSVSTLPEGLVGREAQIAAMSGVISKRSKSTRYLNSCGPVFSISGGMAWNTQPSMPWSE